MQEIILKGIPIGRINGILFDKDGTLVNREKHLIYISKLRISESKNLLKKEGYSICQINNVENLLSKAYGINNNEINPHGSLAIASRKDNLVSTATILCLINGRTQYYFRRVY